MSGIEINPVLLDWARKRSGRKDDYMQKRFPELGAWERGESLPSLGDLEDFARTTYTPIGYLFLDKPPKEQLPVSDFRTVQGAGIGSPSPHLIDTIHLCRRRQTWYREEIKTSGNMPLSFVGSMNTDSDVQSSAGLIRDALGFGVRQRQKMGDWEKVQQRFIEEAENLGILVMVSGVVGNNTHRGLDVDEFRGFALADSLAPLVFINGQDSAAARIFTIAHEIAHIWLGRSAVSNHPISDAPEQSIEKWCNGVAAELLVPSNAIRDEYDQTSELYPEADRLAKIFKVSRMVILRRIYDTGGLNRDEFLEVYNEELALTVRGKGGNYHNNVVSRAGRRFARSLVGSVLEGRTTYVEAMKLLDVHKVSNMKKIARDLGVGR